MSIEQVETNVAYRDSPATAGEATLSDENSYREFPAQELSQNSDECVNLLATYGAVLIRGAIPQDIVRLFQAEAKHAISLLLKDPDKYQALHAFYEKFRNVCPHHLDESLETGLCRILLCLRQNPILRLVQKFLKSDQIVAPLGSMLMRHVAAMRDHGPIGWHQDGTQLEQTAMVTCWIPLDTCGEFAPSLQLALGGPRHLHRVGDFERLIETSDALRVWRLRYEPGDVMIFDPFTIHGTHFHEQMSDVRYSLEIRLVPQEHVFDQPAERIHKLYRFRTDDMIMRTAEQ